MAKITSGGWPLEAYRRGKVTFVYGKLYLKYKLRLIDLHISDITVVNPYLLFKVGSVLNVDEFSLKLEAKD